MKNFLLGCVLAFSGLIASSGTHAQDAGAKPGTSTAILNIGNSQCWDVEGFSTADNAVIDFFPCTGISNQAWAIQTYSFNGSKVLARIVNVNSGMCAAVEDANPASGNIGLRQHACNYNDPLQQFSIDGLVKAYTDGSVVWTTPLLSRSITSVATGQCIVMNPGFSRPIEQPSCGDSSNTASQWRMSGI